MHSITKTRAAKQHCLQPKPAQNVFKFFFTSLTMLSSGCTNIMMRLEVDLIMWISFASDFDCSGSSSLEGRNEQRKISVIMAAMTSSGGYFNPPHPRAGIAIDVNLLSEAFCKHLARQLLNSCDAIMEIIPWCWSSWTWTLIHKANLFLFLTLGPTSS